MGRGRRTQAHILAKLSASVMRSDADWLRRRSVWGYRAALVFFLLALAGPAVAATLLLTNPSPSWYFLVAGLSVGTVPLSIGVLLLRHSSRLDEQHRSAVRTLEAHLSGYLDFGGPALPITVPSAGAGVPGAGEGGAQNVKQLASSVVEAVKDIALE